MTAPDRRRDIDWLRIAATYLLLPYHVAKIFDAEPFFHFKNDLVSPFLDNITSFVHIWHMPLFFLLAGWSAHQSLVFRGGRKFASERVRRILLPLIVGIVVLCPAIGHVEYVMLRGKDLTLWESVTYFFTRFEYFTWSHLWFLVYLLAFTVLTVPWLVRLPRKVATGGRVNPLLVWAPLMILLVAQLILRPHWPGYQNLYDDWANFTFYITFFATGFLMARYPGFETAAHRQALVALVVAVLATLVYFAARSWDNAHLAQGAFAFAALGWVIFALAMAHRKLRDKERGRPYLAESAYPVYILHQWFVVVPGYLLTRALRWPVLPEMLLVLTVATAGTLATYHFLVRPFNLPRLLFGLRARAPINKP